MEDAVLSVLQDDEAVKVKKLRKMVLLSLQMDEDDKDARKSFKGTVQSLEGAGKVKLNEDGLVTLTSKGSKMKKKKRKKDKKEKNNESSSSKKRRRSKSDEDDESADDKQPINDADDEKQDNTNESSSSSSTPKKNTPCKGNPQGVTRLFLGNLPFAVDETSLEAFLPGVTHIRWITDKETGKFYGSAFIEMDTSENAADAVCSKAGTQLMGRPIKITFAPSRPGDVWPPPKKVMSGGGGATNGAGSSGSGGGGQAGGKGIKAMSAKPDGCIKLFLGNLSYDVDDDQVKKFFGTVDAEVKALRWLHHKDSGDFKGCGYAEFWNTEACEKAATLNGKNLLGRPIRIDWTD